MSPSAHTSNVLALSTSLHVTAAFGEAWSRKVELNRWDPPKVSASSASRFDNDEHWRHRQRWREIQFIEGIDLPGEVVRAHAEGRLVLFIGAGASKSKPSSLPLFHELATELGKLANVPFTPDHKDKIDSYIGSLPADFDAHRHAAKLLQPEGSAPNDLHRALVRLACSGAEPKIVTTNFDIHLSTAAEELGMDIGDRWIGPALPLGRDFRGIVHLHGSLSRHHNELILDDRDFGRAYFGDGWAPRFLQPMFDSHVVLFVGYSLSDTVMRYLTLGLPSHTSRFALVPEGGVELSDLDRLHVTPISYPNPDGKHAVLHELLDEWGYWSRMELGDHQARIKRIVDQWKSDGDNESETHAGALSVVEEDYLRAQIESVEGATTFASNATSVRWLEWADRLPQFSALFSPNGELSAVADVLARWFAWQFAASPKLSGAAMSSLQRHNQSLHPTVIRQILFAIHGLEDSDPDVVQRWRVVLATSIHRFSASELMTAIVPFNASPIPLHASIVRKALTPYLKLSSPFSLGTTQRLDWPRAEAAWALDAHYMREQIGRWVDAPPISDDRILATLESALLAAYELLDAYFQGEGSNPLDWGRSAIEEHAQDRRDRPVDTIINALRDLGVSAPPTPIPLHERWWAYEYSLFRRLALHLVAVSFDLTADEKIEWTLQHSLLYEFNTKHETFQILLSAVATASSRMRERLLDAVLLGSAATYESERWERTRTYEIYNLLVWLHRADPDWPEAAEQLRRMQEEHPDFTAREHPDFSSWHEIGSWVPEAVIPIEDFAQQVAQDPVRALEALVTGPGEDGVDHDYFREDYALIRGTAAEHPRAAVALWDASLDDDLPDDQGLRIRTALVEGWTNADLGETAVDILRRVSHHASMEDRLYPVTEFLLGQSRKVLEGPDTEFSEGMRALAVSIWDRYQDSFHPRAGAEPAMMALNTWPGDLVYFWITQIQRRWREAGEGWSGLNAQERGALTALLSGPKDALLAVWPAVGRELYFFDAADPRFTDAQVLPLFGREESLSAVWEPYLYSPRCSGRLLRAGLLDAIVDLFARLRTLNLEQQLAGQFESLAASVVTFAALQPSDRQRVLDAAVISEAGSHATAFAAAVVDQLRDDPPKAQEAWGTWLHAHIVRRIDGVPRDPTLAELSQWVEIVPALGSDIPAAVQLFSGREIGLGEDRFPREFPDGALTAHGEVLVAHLTERVRNTSQADLMTDYRIRELVNEVCKIVGDDVAQPLVEAARKKGIDF